MIFLLAGIVAGMIVAAALFHKLIFQDSRPTTDGLSAIPRDAKIIPIKGEFCWSLRNDNKSGPWPKEMPYRPVFIRDVADGWVRYSHGKDLTGMWSDERMEVAWFTRIYAKYEKATGENQ